MTSPTDETRPQSPSSAEPDAAAVGSRRRRFLTRGSVAAGTLMLVAAGVMAPATLASWNNNSSVSAGIITAGELKVAATGTPVWTETTPNITPRTITPAGRLISPGDTFEAKYDYAVTGAGDNLAATFKVSPVGTQSLPAGVTAQYTVTAGTTTTPRTNLNATSSAVRLPSVPSTATVRIYLVYSATATQNSSATNTLVNLNDIKLTVDQVRSEGGFL